MCSHMVKLSIVSISFIIAAIGAFIWSSIFEEKLNDKFGAENVFIFS